MRACAPRIGGVSDAQYEQTCRAAASSMRFVRSPSASATRPDAPRLITPDGRRTRLGAVGGLGLTWLVVRVRVRVGAGVRVGVRDRWARTDLALGRDLPHLARVRVRVRVGVRVRVRVRVRFRVRVRVRRSRAPARPCSSRGRRGACSTRALAPACSGLGLGLGLALAQG